MRRAWLLVLLAPLCSGTEEPAATEVVLKLRDGSVVRGTSPLGSSFRMSRGGQEIEIPWDDVWSVTWSKKKDADLVLHKGGAWEGDVLTPARFGIDTGFGTMEVPAADARFLRVGGKRSFVDDFETAELRAWRQGGSGRWTIRDRRLHGSSGHPPDALQFRDDLDGAWAVEIDVDPQAGRGQGGLCWHTGGTASPMLLVHPNAAFVYMVVGGSWNSLHTWRMPRGAGSRRVRLAVDGHKATVSVDGRKLGDVKTGTESGRLELLVTSGEVIFDNFRIEK